MNKKFKLLLVFLAALGLVVSSCTTSSDDDDNGDDNSNAGNGDSASGNNSGATLAKVETEGKVRCGTRGDLPGFASTAADGTRSGFDTDFCRAVGAAIFGEGGADKVEFVDLETATRLEDIKAGKADVLIRNTTRTATRDGRDGMTFARPNFYDGQSTAVPASSAANSMEDIPAGATICVAEGTTSQRNLESENARLGKDWEAKAFQDPDKAIEEFVAGNCEAYTADKSQLVSKTGNLDPAPKIFDETISREPLAPAVAEGDEQWAQIIDWTINVTILAEELGIDSTNVDEMLNSEDPAIQAFLGVDVSDADNPGLGLPSDFAYQVIKQVGNYGEIYERNLAPLGVERDCTLNDLAINGCGGVHYGIPLNK